MREIPVGEKVSGTFRSALATQKKTPLSEAAPPAPGRSQKTAQRSTVARNRLIVGGVVALLLVGGGVYLATRGGNPLIDIPVLGAPAHEVPAFAFELGKTSIEPMTLDGRDAQSEAADQTADTVKASLDEMYVVAFLDPDTWGDTGEIEDFFTGEAADQLEGDEAAITLGIDASDTYEYVSEPEGQLEVRVLTNENGSRIAQADVTFRALAEHTDGTYTTVTSTATYFFVKDGDAWRIQSYRVDRNEKAAEAPSPTAAATGSGDAG